MSKRSALLAGVLVLFVVPLIASCGSNKQTPPPPPVKKEEVKPPAKPEVKTEKLPEVAPDTKYQFENIHFEFDKYRLLPEAQGILTEHAKVLMRNPTWSVLIAGNCDERGTVEYNLALGEKRAKAAKEFLVRFGVKADNIRTVSYGKERPIDPGHNEAAWAKNRRDEFQVTR
jgi:peptidoglycan-associated lipoprotein